MICEKWYDLAIVLINTLERILIDLSLDGYTIDCYISTGDPLKYALNLHLIYIKKVLVGL